MHPIFTSSRGNLKKGKLNNDTLCFFRDFPPNIEPINIGGTKASKNPDTLIHFSYSRALQTLDNVSESRVCDSYISLFNNTFAPAVPWV